MIEPHGARLHGSGVLSTGSVRGLLAYQRQPLCPIMEVMLPASSHQNSRGSLRTACRDSMLASASRLLVQCCCQTEKKHYDVRPIKINTLSTSHHGADGSVAAKGCNVSHAGGFAA